MITRKSGHCYLRIWTNSTLPEYRSHNHICKQGHHWKLSVSQVGETNIAYHIAGLVACYGVSLTQLCRGYHSFPLRQRYEKTNPAITKKPMCSRPSDLSRACSACQIAVDIIHVSRNMNGRGGVSNHRRFHYLLNRLFRRRSKKTPTRRTASLCEGNSPVNSPHKGPVTRKMFPFDDVIMESVKVVGANLALNSIYVNITGCGTSHGIVRKGLTGIFKHMHIHLGGLFQQRINQCVNRSMWNVSISRRRGLLKQSTRLTSKSHSVMTVSWGLLGCRGPVLPTWFHLNPSLDK